MFAWVAKLFGGGGGSTSSRASDVVGPPPVVPPSDAREFIVAEISFSRDDTPDNYRRLGEAIVAVKAKHAWLTGVGGLEKLLAGECPDHFSKAVGDGAGGFRPLYDPLLVWGKGIHPGQAIELLRRELPMGLGWVNWPDPDGGV